MLAATSAMTTASPSAASPAGTAHKHHALPNPCTSISTSSLRKLFAAPPGTHFTKTRAHNSDGPQCLVTYSNHSLSDTFDRKDPGIAPPAPGAHFYSRPRLGAHGYVETDQAYSNARGRVHSFYFVVSVNMHLRHKAARMYRFALAQRRSIKRS
jgi:hypothetical protein